MEKLAVGVLLFAALVFFAPLLGVVGGSFSGWVLTQFGFEGVILDFLSRIGANIEGLHLWQVGAAMGFLGGFLKTSTTTRSNND